MIIYIYIPSIIFKAVGVRSSEVELTLGFVQFHVHTTIPLIAYRPATVKVINVPRLSMHFIVLNNFPTPPSLYIECVVK
jgi:hypothetical protein